MNYRKHLEDYIKVHPEFVSTLTPFPDDPFAPPIVREMIRETKDIGLGPMASVAGAIAHYIGKEVAEGIIHESFGWLVFVIALALLFLVSKFLDWLMPEQPAE